MGMYLGNSKISFSIGTLSQVSEDRIVSQMSAAIAQVVDKVNEEVLPFHFYSEDEWDIITNSDTNYSAIPSGMIYIYEESISNNEEAEFNKTSSIIQLPADSLYDIDSSILTLGTSFTLSNDILIENIL